LPGLTLSELGWSSFFEDNFDRDVGLVPGRVAVQHRGAYVLYSEDGELWAEPAGRLARDGDLPAVGDWVGASIHGDRARIEHLLPRRTAFARRAPHGETVAQVLAANLDTVLLVAALTRDLNARRLERYLTLAWDSGAAPVVVLAKADLCEDVGAALRELEPVTLGIPVHVTSAVTGAGLEELGIYLRPAETVALLGSSGVGKSTLINRLVGAELQATAEIRPDGKGRHTTTRRELIRLPGGAFVVDTPGMRELQLWAPADGAAATFADVEELAAQCRFRDCRHETEPGCAVGEAIATGALERERLRSFRRLQAELARLERKQDERLRLQAQREMKRRYRAFAKQSRARRRPS
jgi:ribosome biogenesis GTPase / thiamine phosphate phosphatase